MPPYTRDIPGNGEIRLGVRQFAANPNFTREFDADQVGLELALEAVKRLEVAGAASLLGAVLSLRAIEILDNVQSLGGGEIRAGRLGALANCANQPAGGTHPPTSCRVWLLKQHARKEPDVLRQVELLEKILDHLCTELSFESTAERPK